MRQHFPSQWDGLLQHLGAWRGSFTRISPQGDVLESQPTLLTLEGLEENQVIRQTIQFFSPITQELVNEKVLEYSTLSRSVLFFETGAFSQGSMQFGPFAEFGAEFGFITGDRRLRLISLFGTDGCLREITLIREYRQHAAVTEYPALTVDQLLGSWPGEAITLYPDLRSPDHSVTTLNLQRQAERLRYQIKGPGLEFTATASLQGNVLQFERGNFPVQTLLLPDGASCTTPLTIPRDQPFFLEAGWLIPQAQQRQRLTRRYDAKGGWSSLTLITETKA